MNKTTVTTEQPSKRSLHRLLHRGLTPTQASWAIVPHKQNETLRLSIVRRCEAILKSWGSR